MRWKHWVMVVFAVVLLSFHPAQAEEIKGGEASALQAAVWDRCLSTLRAGLASAEFWPSMHAAEALTAAGAGPEVVASLVVRLPKESNDQRRCGLARELVRAGNRDSLPVLFAILGEPKSIGRVHAAESLYKLGEISDGKLLGEAFRQTEIPQLRLMAAAALARGGDAEALTWLRGQLVSPDRAIRNTVAFALAGVGNASDIPPLAKVLAAETDPLGRAIVVDTLATLGDDAARKALAEGLASQDPAIRVVAVEAIGRARAVEHRAKLVERLDDAVLDVRVRAAQALLVLSQLPIKR